MAVDSDMLKIKILSLKALIANTRMKIREAENTIKVLEGILPDTPKDTVTGLDMTATRRQEIYDACTPVADKLITWGRKTEDQVPDPAPNPGE